MSFRDLFGKFGRRSVDPESLPIEGVMPEFTGITRWINGGPLTKADLAGKVVLVDFWTYSCINCIRTLPYVNGWQKAYSDKGLVVVGVHTPEFDFEKDAGNVKAAVTRFGLNYAIALDNDYAMWNAYKNRYWPAHYFIDAKGNIRYHHFGEGGYGHSEAVIRTLLKEAGHDTDAPPGDIPQTTQFEKIGTPETYLGGDRVEYLGSPESVRVGAAQRYSIAKSPAQNIFYFAGLWEVQPQFAVPMEPGARIVYRYRASKANVVMDGGGLPLKAEVTMDGKPLDDHNKGTDVTLENGKTTITIKDGRLYNLIDTRGVYGSHVLEITFLDPTAKVYAFTFG